MKLTREDVFERVLQDWREKLNDGNSWPKKQLIEATSADLCEAYLATSNCSAYSDLVNPHELAWVCFDKEVFPKLLADDRYEVERGTADGKEHVRLDPSLVSERGPAPIAKSADAPRASANIPVKQVAEADLASAADDPPVTDEFGVCAAAALAEAMAAIPAAEIQGEVTPELLGNSAVRLVDPDLPIHELANLIPETGHDDYERMKEDMRVNGQQVPALLYQGKILDGRTRQKIAQELGVRLAVQEWQGSGSPASFVVSLNLHRRHLDASQRAMVAARIKPLFEEEARQRKRAGKTPDLRANLPEGRPRDQAAEILHVSPRSVETASTVIKKGTPELVQAVETGAVSVAAAAELAGLSAEEQRTTLKEGKKAVKAQAKKRREKKVQERRRRVGKTQPQRNGQAELVAEAPNNGEDSSDMLAIYKPTSDAQRQALAESLQEFLGRTECEALARAWAPDEEKAKVATRAPRPRSSVGPVEAGNRANSAAGRKRTGYYSDFF